MQEIPEKILNDVREAFKSGKTKSYEFRVSQLKAIKKFIESNEVQIVSALKNDLNRSNFETYLTEIIHLKNDIQHALNHLKDWMRPSKPSKPLAFKTAQVEIHPEPYGVVLIIGSWNYPFALTLSPLIGAISAGNCAVIKPSEVSSHSSKLMEKLSHYLDPSCYYVYTGGAAETAALLMHRFDYIFYTGSTSVGRIIYKSAAEFLTPVTLELGGKCPVYISDSVDFDICANRIIWGKCINAGQSCIEPDYILCSEYAQNKFIEAAKKTLKQWFGENLKNNKDLTCIINENHFKRVLRLLQGQKIALGGESDAKTLFIEPTIVVDVKPNDLIMEEEIFGPILPILTVSSPEEAIEFINNREKPLALYAFSTSKMEQNKFIKSTSSGGVCINDVMMHYSCDTLPFGGVGNSGIGQYHGLYSFETFSHQKATLVQDLSKFDEVSKKLRYPPYSENKLKVINLVTKVFPKLPGSEFINPLSIIILAIIFFLFIHYYYYY